MTNKDSVFCSRDTVNLESFSIVDQINTTWSWTINPSPLYISNTSSRNPKVVFGSSGSFDVTLDITNDQNHSSSMMISDMIVVNNYCEADTIPGMSIELSTSGEYVQLPDMNKTTNSFTVTAWIKPTGFQDDYASILMNDGDAAGLNFREGNNTLGYHWPGGAWWWDSNLEVDEGVWSHVALVAEPSGITIYLNGLGVKHSTSINTVDLGTMKIGSYKAWTSRNYRGEIDEVALWNRALSQNEIRSHRHLTKEDLMSDTDFLAYYQFNKLPNGQVMDKIGVRHGQLTNSNLSKSSNGPFGGGESDFNFINASGTYAFNNNSVSLEFAGTGSLPNGEIYVSRINILPYSYIHNIEGLGSYLIVNNYGDQNFTANVGLTFDDPYSSPSSEATLHPELLSLYQREANSDLVTWSKLCALSSTSLEDYVFDVSLNCLDADFGQFFLWQCVDNTSITIDYNINDNVEIQVQDFINAYNKIFTGAQATYRAGNEINLQSNFEVKAGAIFETIMEGCEY